MWLTKHWNKVFVIQIYKNFEGAIAPPSTPLSTPMQCAFCIQLLRKELQKQDESGTELDTNDLLFTIMNRKYSKERKKAKLLATILTFSDTSVNQRAPSGMTALHHAVQVRYFGRGNPMCSHQQNKR